LSNPNFDEIRADFGLFPDFLDPESAFRNKNEEIGIVKATETARKLPKMTLDNL
jgi:hypothetical protein